MKPTTKTQIKTSVLNVFVNKIAITKPKQVILLTNILFILACTGSISGTGNEIISTNPPYSARYTMHSINYTGHTYIMIMKKGSANIQGLTHAGHCRCRNLNN